MKLSVSLTISIHAPLRERPAPTPVSEVDGAVSIHAPLRERRILDNAGLKHKPISIFFTDTAPPALYTLSLLDALPTFHAPLRERRILDNAGFNHQPISIHAPLRERLWMLSHSRQKLNFNPRSLAGATRQNRAHGHKTI